VGVGRETRQAWGEPFGGRWQYYVAENARWSFDGISGSFAAHARRSIPFYDAGHDLICRYSDYFVAPSSVVYDIGTTTGLLAHKIADRYKSKPGVRVIGIDLIPSMIEYCQQQYADREDLFSTNGNIEMLQRAGFKDITSVMKWVCFEGFLAIK
jgi:SAM-dependent methyltransferase